MAETDAGAEREQIERNIAVHNQVAKKYAKLHGEIFNEVEQNRLARALARAGDAIRTEAQPKRALDFGCGSGNLTRHMLDLGFHVTAADVSADFLRLVERNFGSDRLNLLQLNGKDLSNVADRSFDLIAAYSVLHHIPDYLGALRELGRVCKLGGVIMLDHEQNEEYWRRNPAYAAFRREALRFDWRKFLTPTNYAHRLRRIFEPRHSNEGDIHVWPDDHIEWTGIKSILRDEGFLVVLEDDYLLYRDLYRPEVYDRYAGHLSDTKLLIARKRVA